MKNTANETERSRRPYKRRPQIGPYGCPGQAKLGELLRERGILQTELARQLGSSGPVISDVLHAHSRPSLALIQRIVDWSRERAPNGELSEPRITHQDWLLDSERAEG